MAATQAQVDDLRKLHVQHVADDATALRELNGKLDHILETTARKDDLERVETNLTQILVNNFRAPPRR